MAGRRLSSNDIGVVIALAIVVLVLLLIFIVERDAARGDGQAAAGTAGTQAEIGASVAAPAIGSAVGEVGVAGQADPCGIATLQPAPGRSDDASAAHQRDEAVHAILAALAARPEARARAAGLYFRAARDRLETRVADVCRQRPDACTATERRPRDDRDSTAELARLAVESADPQVYAWAYRSCALSAHDIAASCQLVNALQWARLDPSNAEPWFAVAAEARVRRDPAALDDAMFHVAAASTDDSGWARAAAQMIEAAPTTDRTIVGTWLASLDAITYETLDLAMPVTWRYCDARAIANANRRETCEKIATLLVERSTTLIDRAVGVALGKTLGWAPERLAAFEREGDAAHALDVREASPSGGPLDCGNVRRDLSRWVEVARVGEVEALRRRVAATGESMSSLATEGRQAARVAADAELARGVASTAASAAVATGPEASLPLSAR